MFGRKRPKKPESLLDAIEEEVAEPRAGTPTGAIPIETNVRKKRIEAFQDQVVSVARRPRTLVLLVLLLVAVLELAAVKWTEDASEAIERQHTSALRVEPPRQTAAQGEGESARLADSLEAGIADDAGESSDAGAPADAGTRADAGEAMPEAAREKPRKARRIEKAPTQPPEAAEPGDPP